MTDQNPFEAMMKMGQDWAKSMNLDMDAFTPKGFEALWPTMPAETMEMFFGCLLYTSPSPRDLSTSRMPSSA